MPLESNKPTVDQGAKGVEAWPVDTELPAAIELPTILPNPSAPYIAALLYVKSGTNWVPWAGSSGEGDMGDVNLTQMAGAPVQVGNGTAAGCQRVVIANDDAWQPSVNVLNATLTVTATSLDIRDLSAASDSLAAFQAGAWTVGVNNHPTSLEVEGKAPTDAPISGKPVLQGLHAREGEGTLVANGDAVPAMGDRAGRAVALIGAPLERFLSGRLALSNTTAGDVISAQGAGVRVVVTNLAVSNAHGTTGTKVEIRSGAAVRYIMQAEENGGGCTQSNPHGIFVGGANEAITARCVTTGADVEVFVSGYLASF